MADFPVFQKQRCRDLLMVSLLFNSTIVLFLGCGREAGNTINIQTGRVCNYRKQIKQNYHMKL